MEQQDHAQPPKSTVKNSSNSGPDQNKMREVAGGDAPDEGEAEDEERNDKSYFKLADYFVTIGVDNYYSAEEIYR